MVVSKEALIYSYMMTFTVLLVVMTNVCQYFYMHQPRKPDCWGRWGPLVLMTSSTVLLLLTPLKNLVLNVCMTSFRQNGFDPTIEHLLDIAYLPAFATRPMQVYTTLGYVFMLWGTAMQVDLFGKFRATLVQCRSKEATAKW